jgi:hypothetical protein
MVDKFVKFAADYLKLKNIPPIQLIKEKHDSASFGGYSPSEKHIIVATKNRHPMDIFRTLTHELVHAKQDEDGHVEKAGDAAGDTGHPLENEANSVAGIIMRNWGRKNPDFFSLEYVAEEVIQEGIYDQGKMKAVFLAGGPGSGKDFVMNKVLAGNGLTEINSDVALEFLMKRHGLDLEMPDEEKVERDIVRGRAKNVTKEKERLALAGRKGLIINGTADDINKIATIKKSLEDQGYETMMVFVNTSNDVSRERNVERGKMGKRKVPDGTDKQGKPDDSPDIRQEKWEAAQKNIGEFQKIFGQDSFVVIDNTQDIRKVSPEEKNEIETNFNRVRRMTTNFVRTENRNPKSNEWDKAEAQKRSITYTPPRTFAPVPAKAPPQHANVITKPSNVEMEQARRLGLSYYGFGRFGRAIKGKNTVLYTSQNGRLVPKTKSLTEMVKKMKNDPCWSGYEMIGKKKKGGREVPNCVPVKENETDKKFKSFMEEHGAGFEGTKQLRDKYMKDTPGETMPGRTAVSSPFFQDNKAKIKKKLVKKLNKEDNSLALGYEFGNNGIGDTFSIPRSPSGTGIGYSIPQIAGYVSEAINSWANSPKTMQKFTEKYGNLAEQKIVETALRISELKDEYGSKGLYSGRGDDVEEQSPDLMSIMPRKSDYIAKFPGVKGNPPVEAQYDKMRAIKHRDAHLYASEHNPTKMVGPNAKKDKRKLEEEQINERGEDSKGYYRSTESGAGLTRKGAKHFGIQTAVTTPPSKLKKGSKAAKRRKSFCARMGGMPGPMKDEKGRPTRKAMSLRRWNCEE